MATGGKFGVKAVKAVHSADTARAFLKSRPSMVPAGAQKLPWSPNAKFAYGDSYKWTDPNSGKTVRYHSHGIDPARSPTENAGSGPVYRVKEGGHYLDSAGNKYTENAVNPNSSAYNPAAANDTHIPYPASEPPPGFRRAAVPNPAALLGPDGDE